MPRMTPHGFAYVAFREHEQGASSRALFASPVWRRWLLDATRVAELFNQAERIGVLRFSQAGSAVRVDWRVGSLEEVAVPLPSSLVTSGTESSTSSTAAATRPTCCTCTSHPRVGGPPRPRGASSLA